MKAFVRIEAKEIIDGHEIEIDIPCIPRIGEYFFLSKQMDSDISFIIKRDIGRLWAYSDWFYGFSRNFDFDSPITNDILECFSLSDVILVKSITYSPQFNYYPIIELSDTMKEKD